MLITFKLTATTFFLAFFLSFSSHENTDMYCDSTNEILKTPCLEFVDFQESVCLQNNWDIFTIARCNCRDCDKTMVGSHKHAIFGKRCDSCYQNRQRRLGNNYFCSNCLYAASGDTGKSFALNNGLCSSCHRDKKNAIMNDCSEVEKCYKKGY